MNGESKGTSRKYGKKRRAASGIHKLLSQESKNGASTTDPFLVIILHLTTPSNNQLLRMHFMERKRLRKQYGWELVAVGAHDPKYKVKWRERRIVKLKSFRPGTLDSGNLAGGFKELEDSLVNMGLLFDDSPKYAEIIYSQEIDTKDPRTEIKLYKEE